MSEWMPIETAPKDGTPILAFSPDSDPSVYVIAWVNSGFDGKDYSGWREAGGEGYERFVPTHWQPLPEPPRP